MGGKAEKMPSSYTIDKQRRLVVVRAWGACTVEDVLDFRRQLTRDPDFEPGLALLADLTAITSLAVTPHDIRMLTWSTPFAVHSRRAFVAELPLAFAFSRIYESLLSVRGNREVRVFRNRDEAMAWLLQPGEAV